MVDTSIHKIILPAESNSLVIEVSGDDWAKCFLVGTERIFLGADDFSLILTRLQDALGTRTVLKSQVDGEIEGFPVVWLLSLAEAHHVLYVALSGEDYLLFWQNAHQSPVTTAGVLHLTPKHRRQWQQQLKALSHDQFSLVNGHRQFISGEAAPVAAEALK